MTNPVIVDLLPELQIVNHPVGVTMIGRFNRETSTLDYDLVKIRMLVILGEIEKIEDPSPITFYIHENWQSFAIIAGICNKRGIEPRVLVMNWASVEIDLHEFYCFKGGDELQGGKARQSYVIPQFPYLPQTEAPHE